MKKKKKKKTTITIVTLTIIVVITVWRRTNRYGLMRGHVRHAVDDHWRKTMEVTQWRRPSKQLRKKRSNQPADSLIFTSNGHPHSGKNRHWFYLIARMQLPGLKMLREREHENRIRRDRPEQSKYRGSRHCKEVSCRIEVTQRSNIGDVSTSDAVTQSFERCLSRASPLSFGPFPSFHESSLYVLRSKWQRVSSWIMGIIISTNHVINQSHDRSITQSNAVGRTTYHPIRYYNRTID